MGGPTKSKKKDPGKRPPHAASKNVANPTDFNEIDEIATNSNEITIKINEITIKINKNTRYANRNNNKNR